VTTKIMLDSKQAGYMLQLVAADMERMRHLGDHARAHLGDHARAHGERNFACEAMVTATSVGDALVQFFAALKVEQDFAARHAESVAAGCICREVSGGFLRLEDGCPVHAPLPRPNRDECPHCGGDGGPKGEPCRFCKGTGFVELCSQCGGAPGAHSLQCPMGGVKE